MFERMRWVPDMNYSTSRECYRLLGARVVGGKVSQVGSWVVVKCGNDETLQRAPQCVKLWAILEVCQGANEGGVSGSKEVEEESKTCLQSASRSETTRDFVVRFNSEGYFPSENEILGINIKLRRAAPVT